MLFLGCRNHERDWPGTVDQRSALANNVDSGGECGVIYDKRLGLGMPILKRAPAASRCLETSAHIPDPHLDQNPEPKSSLSRSIP